VSLSVVTDEEMGMTKMGWMHLIRIDFGVKMNGPYYGNVLLTQELLPVICVISLVSLLPSSTPSMIYNQPSGMGVLCSIEYRVLITWVLSF